MTDKQWPEEDDFEEIVINEMNGLYAEEYRREPLQNWRPIRLGSVDPDLLGALKDALPNASSETLSALERDLHEAFKQAQIAWQRNNVFNKKPSTLRRDEEALRRWIAHAPDAAPKFILIYLRYLADWNKAKVEDIDNQESRKKQGRHETWPVEFRKFAGLLFDHLARLQNTGAREATQAVIKALWQVTPPSSRSLYNWKNELAQ